MAPQVQGHIVSCSQCKTHQWQCVTIIFHFLLCKTIQAEGSKKITGSGSRIEASNNPYARAGEEESPRNPVYAQIRFGTFK